MFKWRVFGIPAWIIVLVVAAGGYWWWRRQTNAVADTGSTDASSYGYGYGYSGSGSSSAYGATSYSSYGTATGVSYYGGTPLQSVGGAPAGYGSGSPYGGAGSGTSGPAGPAGAAGATGKTGPAGPAKPTGKKMSQAHYEQFLAYLQAHPAAAKKYRAYAKNASGDNSYSAYAFVHSHPTQLAAFQGYLAKHKNKKPSLKQVIKTPAHPTSTANLRSAG